MIIYCIMKVGSQSQQVYFTITRSPAVNAFSGFYSWLPTFAFSCHILKLCQYNRTPCCAEIKFLNPRIRLERLCPWSTFSHLVEDGFDVDRQVSVRAAEPSYDAEAQAR